MNPTPTEFYRYDDIQYESYVRVHEDRYHFIKETPCGYWISYYRKGHPFALDDKKWVSKTARKRFAYPTRMEAQISFKARKNAQIRILSTQLKRAKNALLDFERHIEGNL